MKFIKRLVVVVLILLVLCGVGLGVLAYSLDSIAKSGIEKGGTYALGVPTRLESADIGVLRGTFSMTGLDVANPPGYQSASFFKLGSGTVAANLGSINKPVIEVPRFELSTIRVNLERNDKGANYQQILDNLKKFESKGTSGTAEKGEGRKFVVKEILIRDVEVKVDLVGLGPASTSVSVPIHEIKLSNVGNAQGGLTSAQITDVVVKAVLASASQNGGGIIPADVLGDLNGSLSQLEGVGDFGVEVVGKAGDSAQKLIKDLGSEAEKAGNEIKKTLEGLLPGKK